MSVPKILALRLTIYSILVGYLLIDLFVMSGPLYRALTHSPMEREAAIAEAKANGMVARVYFRPIYKAQVENAMVEYLWRRGRGLDQTTPAEREIIRNIMLNRLIDQELLKLQVKVSSKEEVEVSEKAISREYATEAGRFSEGKFEELAEVAGWEGRGEHKMRVAARIQREQYLDRTLNAEVGKGEVRQWFEENGEMYEGAEFEGVKESIRAALVHRRKQEAWRQFRNLQLRPRAEGGGKIEIFQDVLHAEEGE